MENSHLTLEPLRAKPAESFNSPTIEVICLIGAPPLEKVSSCFVKSFACRHAFSASIIIPPYSGGNEAVHLCSVFLMKFHCIVSDKSLLLYCLLEPDAVIRIDIK